MSSRGGKFVKNEEVVITGISGTFPKSDNVQEFKENLFSGAELYSDNERYEIVGKKAHKMGMIKTLDRFDHTFFRVNRHQAETMSISGRILLEKVYEAIFDTGYSPNHFEGTNTGVFIGKCFEDQDLSDIGADGKAIADLSSFRCMIANRISYCLNIHGPSVVLDSACSSSFYALEMAYTAIQNGNCDAAIVGSANLGFLPHITAILDTYNVISPSGCIRPFDSLADGFIRADAVVAIILQKRKDARRIYADVVHIKTNCDGYKEEGITFPSMTSHEDLFRQLYQEIQIDPQLVSYIETHGTGTKVGDPVEVNSIEKIFCPNRTTALKIGSVKSNMGHGEASAGLCSLIKVIIAFETGLIPPNINYQTPNPSIESLLNGNIEVVTKPLRCEGEYFAINSYGIGGANAHLLLSPQKKHKASVVLDSRSEKLPRLVVVSGRTEEAVYVILKETNKNAEDVEYIKLIHEIFSENIPGHLYRGYRITNVDDEKPEYIKYFTGERRPIWFIFAGMGSQWPAMGKSLMTLPIFAESIYKSHKIMQTKSIDLLSIITDDDPKIFDNILNSFIGIAAMQIALVDILKVVGVEPDGIIGHSVGELGCAYADGCLTAEQMLLAAYYRGWESVNSEVIHGTMASIGIGYEDIKKLLPSEIDVAAHNNLNNCTISGPTNIVKKFMAVLEEKSVFVREVNVSNIPYHSRYITSLGPKFRSDLEKIIPVPKLRSNKWICTSLPKNEWGNDEAKYSSSEYHTNNLLNPVYFEEGLLHIPHNAIIIEIAPHGLLQAILKRSLPSSVDNIPLTLEGSEDGVKLILNALGRIYTAGGTLKISNLYPAVEFPVSKGTPMISPLIRWQHNEQWPITKYAKKKKISGEREVMLNLKSEEYSYLRDHVVDGRNLFPGVGYLYFVWETIASMQQMKFNEVSVVFENIRFERATNILKTQNHILLHIAIHKGTGNFEVTENDATVVTGTVRIPENIDNEWINLDSSTQQKNSLNSNSLLLSTKDFYKLLRLRGYHYKGLFKKVLHVNHSGTYGKVAWCNNFVTFIDTIAQLVILQRDVDRLLVPTFIRKLTIDVKKHYEILNTLDKKNTELPVSFYSHLDLLCSGGVQILQAKTSAIAQNKNLEDPILEKYLFVPYIKEEKMDINSSVKLCTQIALENNHILKVKTLELLDVDHISVNKELLSNIIAVSLMDVPLIQVDVNIWTDSQHQTLDDKNLTGINIVNEIPSDHSCWMVGIHNISKNKNLTQILNALQNEGFIISIETITSNLSFDQLGLTVCFSRLLDDKTRIVLLRKYAKINPDAVLVKIDNTSYSWISEIQNTIESIRTKDNSELIVYAEKNPLSGILGFFNCLKKDEPDINMKCFFMKDENTPTFTLQNTLYKTQYEQHLIKNVYENREWGSYCYLPLEPLQDKEVPYAYCIQLINGDLSSYRWVEDLCDSAEVPAIHVYYSSLNFRDVMHGVGRIDFMDRPGFKRFDENNFCGEFGGKSGDGQRYVGFTKSRVASNIIIQDPYYRQFIWKVPDHLSLEDASTIPIAYTTVIYALFYKIQLRRGCSILIHAGSGGIGQAAINICSYYECNIFTTVGTPQKKEYIKSTFPQIPENHIGCSRDSSFQKLIMEQTNGRGVDVVLNSLSGHLLQASLYCVAKGGDFIELGKADMIQNNTMEMGPFLKSITFRSVNLDDQEVLSLELRINLQKQIQSMLEEGIIKPIPSTVFSINEVETAIRYMATAKHIGKVMIKIRNEEKDKHAKPSPIHVLAQPRLLCSKTLSYVIIGGLGGFGLELTDWLVLRGAKNIVLSSRNGIKDGYQSYKIGLWRSYGVTIIICTQDITNENGVKNLLQEANALGPVAAIFNSAIILSDSPFNQQTEQTFDISAGPKAKATLYLDKLSRQMCPHLKHFVVFSSISCGRGNSEQSNYGMSNSIMEQICEMRQSNGLPALAIQWGPIGDVGIFSDLFQNDSTAMMGGYSQQRMKSCLETLDRVLHQNNAIVSSVVVGEKRHTYKDIISVVANILGIRDLKAVSLTWTLPELGMDSVMSLELQQVIQSEFGIFLTPQDIRNMTFGKLQRMKDNKGNT